MAVQIRTAGLSLSLSRLFCSHVEPFSIKARLTNRRQPILAYSTRRKNLPLGTSTVPSNQNQSLLHVNTTVATPKSNKRKLGGCTPAVTPSASKVIKREWKEGEQRMPRITSRTRLSTRIGTVERRESTAGRSKSFSTFADLANISRFRAKRLCNWNVFY